MILAILISPRPAHRAGQKSQPDLANVTGTVHVLGDGWAEIAWPQFRSWHKAGDLELSTPERKIQ